MASAGVGAAVVETTRANALGAQIRELRLARGMTQGELGALLGVTTSTVCMLERNSRGAAFKLATLEQFAWALDAELVIELRPRGA